MRRLPRAVTSGLAGPFARPGRTLVTLTAILLGGTAVTFAAGLATSLDRAEPDLSHSQSEPVQVSLPGGFLHVANPRVPGIPDTAPPPPDPAPQHRPALPPPPPHP